MFFYVDIRIRNGKEAWGNLTPGTRYSTPNLTSKYCIDYGCMLTRVLVCEMWWGNLIKTIYLDSRPQRPVLLGAALVNHR